MLIPVPSKSDINSGLSPCHQSTMISLFGRPGDLTDNCSPVTNQSIKSHITTSKLEYFSVTGFTPAIDDLEQILSEIKSDKPDTYKLIGTAGMLCCRKVRIPGSKSFSNHSWGTAIDLTINKFLSPQNATHIPEELLAIYPYFHKRGWYWGMGFSTSDPMHFEVSDGRIREMHKLL